MERESFEDDETAAFMNEHFVPIKVDREERPDVDAIYMEAVQQMTGHGGWPMRRRDVRSTSPTALCCAARWCVWAKRSTCCW